MAPGTVPLRNPKLHERHIWIATLQSPQRSSWARGAQSWKQSSRAFLPRGPRVKIRVEKRVKKTDFFFDSIFDFLGPGAGRPRELIFNSVSSFGPEGSKNSSGVIEGSQYLESPEFSKQQKKADNILTFLAGPHGEICPPPTGDPHTSPQHADPHGFLVWFS